MRRVPIVDAHKKQAGDWEKPHLAPVYVAQVQALWWSCCPSCGSAQKSAFVDRKASLALTRPPFLHRHHPVFLASSPLWSLSRQTLDAPPHPHSQCCCWWAESQGVCRQNTGAQRRVPSLGWWVLPLQADKHMKSLHTVRIDLNLQSRSWSVYFTSVLPLAFTNFWCIFVG